MKTILKAIIIIFLMPLVLCLGVYACAAVHIRAAHAQDAQVTCSWVVDHQACHTLEMWENFARLWCDRHAAAKARREQEQQLGWGTNAMYASSRGAEFARDQQIEADTLTICSAEQMGLRAAQERASRNMPN
jgi:hypothetical protein